MLEQYTLTQVTLIKACGPFKSGVKVIILDCTDAKGKRFSPKRKFRDDDRIKVGDPHLIITAWTYPTNLMPIYE